MEIKRTMRGWGQVILWLLLAAFLASLVYGLSDNTVGHAVSKIVIPPLYDTPYIMVYGNKCGSTTRTLLSNLDGAGIRYRYEPVVNRSGIDRDVTDSFFPRLVEAGLLQSMDERASLPVVDVNGTMMISPDWDDVLSAYQTP